MSAPPGIDPAAMRARLEALQAELRAQSAGTVEDRKAVELDQQSIGRLSRQDALQQQAMAKAQDVRRGKQLKHIGAALKRIEEGEYGWCADCGDAIAAKRLEIDPAVELCVVCAQ